MTCLTICHCGAVDNTITTLSLSLSHHTHTHTHTHTLSHRFSMLFSETPDMSDTNQEFLQSHQPPHHHQPSSRGGGGGGGVNSQQHQHHQPPPAGGGGGEGGYPNSIPPNSRMGIGMNRNGNNHINHGMAADYVPHPHDNMAPERGYSHHSELNNERPPENFSTNHRNSPPPSSLSSAPLQYQSQSYEFRAKQLGGQGSRSAQSDHADHMGHAINNGRTRGGYRNFYPERHHPYSRPPADPPRHRGGWR